MDNLINFEENSENNKDESRKEMKTTKSPLLINDRLSFELNNPFDKLEYRITHFDDPFECLESRKWTSDNDENDSSEQLSESKHIKQDVLNSTSPASSTAGSFIEQNDSIVSKNKTLKRCQSDSSTTSNEAPASRFNSLDNILSSKTNQLLKLSLLNSPNSPLHSSSRNGLDNSMIDSVLQEARKISDKLLNFNELSFEDLNNVSTQLVDSSNVSMPDADLEQMKISILENNKESTSDPSSSSSSKETSIENIREKLCQIKKEISGHEEQPEVVEIKEEKIEQDEKSDQDFDEILQKIKVLMRDDKKDEAKKCLQKLNELIGPSNEPKQLLQVQPMVRQDTFEIDQATGKRKYSTSGNDDSDINSNGELMEQIAKLFGAQNLDVGTLNLSNGSNNETTKFVVILPQINTPVATPIKQPTKGFHNSSTARRSVSFSSQRPATSTKGIENKKLSTPMKPLTAVKSNATRRNSFAAPRSVSKPSSHPYEQKLNVGAVRKSLMGAMEKSPLKGNANASLKDKKLQSTRPSTTANVRRSVSLKANLPSVKISEASPTKNVRPTTMAAPRSTASANVARANSTSNRRQSSMMSRPSTVSGNSQRLTVSAQRPASKKTEFKTPLSTAKISSHKESLV